MRCLRRLCGLHACRSSRKTSSRPFARTGRLHAFLTHWKLLGVASASADAADEAGASAAGGDDVAAAQHTRVRSKNKEKRDKEKKRRRAGDAEGVVGPGGRTRGAREAKRREVSKAKHHGTSRGASAASHRRNRPPRPHAHHHRRPAAPAAPGAAACAVCGTSRVRFAAPSNPSLLLCRPHFDAGARPGGAAFVPLPKRKRARGRALDGASALLLEGPRAEAVQGGGGGGGVDGVEGVADARRALRVTSLPRGEDVPAPADAGEHAIVIYGGGGGAGDVTEIDGGGGGGGGEWAEARASTELCAAARWGALAASPLSHTLIAISQSLAAAGGGGGDDEDGGCSDNDDEEEEMLADLDACAAADEHTHRLDHTADAAAEWVIRPCDGELVEEGDANNLKDTQEEQLAAIEGGYEE